tara:strand:+ start:110 stop:499 length:390 start_codon:yes stop_codon:yes gene_type:complete
MTKLYLGDEVMNKEQIKKAMDQASRKDPNDKVAEIMTEWYTALGKQGVAIQPKASTILGTILAKHFNDGEPDVFDTYMNTKAGELESFWQSLSNDEKAYVEKRRQEMRDEWYANRGLVDSQDKRTLLKG